MRTAGRVRAVQGGCIANRLRCDARAAFRMPGSVSFAQGCSLLSVYVTAYYSLVHLARMRPGQLVLVHSAMGGVGQAAIALAKHVGARVIGTAGSAGRREKLLAMGCVGAYDSHSTAWCAHRPPPRTRRPRPPPASAHAPSPPSSRRRLSPSSPSGTPT